MFDELFALKLAAVVTIALIFPTTYVVYNKGVFTSKPFAFPRKEDCDYKPQPVQSCSLAVNKTQCYYEKHSCHKNVWKLARKLKNEDPKLLPYLYAVFMSNREGMMLSWRQIGGSEPDGMMPYGYHVVLVYSRDKRSLVFDFDSQLPFPEELHTYCNLTFRMTSPDVPESAQPLFRVIRAESYLQTFLPDLDVLINPADIENSVMFKYMIMEGGQPGDKFGEVLDRFQFLDRFP